MKFLDFLLLIETQLPTVNYKSHLDGEALAMVTLDSGMGFEVTIWPRGGEEASIQFYQLDDSNHAMTGGELDDQKSLSPNEFIQLFLGIEQIIIDYFERYDHIKSMKIHPEAVGKRKNVIDKRKGTGGRSMFFDPNKSNAYMQLFNYSRLKQMGYRIASIGEDIFISRS